MNKSLATAFVTIMEAQAARGEGGETPVYAAPSVCHLRMLTSVVLSLEDEHPALAQQMPHAAHCVSPLPPSAGEDWGACALKQLPIL